KLLHSIILVWLIKLSTSIALFSIVSLSSSLIFVSFSSSRGSNLDDPDTDTFEVDDSIED
ncbi:hypothetical protein KSS87_011165, partial [Heliosperma pusillum]